MWTSFKKALSHLRPKTEQERMEAFFSQAQNRTHLEQLEREWFKNRRY